MLGGNQSRLGEGERQVRLGQDRLAIKKTAEIKRKRAETMYVVLPTPLIEARDNKEMRVSTKRLVD